MPEVYAELDRIQKILESHFKDMQDIEFTVEDNHLYLLQTRTRKRTPLRRSRSRWTWSTKA